MRAGITLSILMFAVTAFAQPPLSKRDQKRKAAFEAQIEAEEKYEKTIEKADAAFKHKNYVEARMLYAEAIQYNPENEQWLTSKVNDLDILMAKNIARAVDSVSVMSPRPLEGRVVARDVTPAELKQRPLTGGSLPIPADSVESGKKQEETAGAPPVTKAEVQVIKEQPVATLEEEVAKEREVKVKEDFSHLPQGLTEQTFDFPDHQVLRIVVKEGIDTIVYKRVSHRWGGKFYFKDEVSMAERIWLEEVEAFRKKYPADKAGE